MNKTLPLIWLALTAAPAFAADTVSLPQNCSAYLTVQSASCLVSHYFTCEGEPAGFQHRIDYDEEGAVYIGTTDAEGQWIKSFLPITGETEFLNPDAVDAASFAELIDTGIDTFDFTTASDMVGETHYRGFDRLTGETLALGGIVLEETEYEVHATGADGEPLWSSSGHEYVLRDHHIFVAGRSTYDTPDGPFEADDSPQELIGPDGAGFLSIHPKYGCGATMSSLPLSLIPAAEEHDDDQI